MTGKTLNSGLLVTIGLLLFAIFASVSVAVIAFTRGDPTLPDEYHWEGMSLDRDFADARRASDLDVRAMLRISSRTGACRVTLQLGSKLPPTLVLNLVHATEPDLDRRVQLSRVGAAYEGRCGEVPSGHWHLELSDITGSWSVRSDVSGALDGTIISARPDRGVVSGSARPSSSPGPDGGVRSSVGLPNNLPDNS
jgi:hypothetical protein